MGRIVVELTDRCNLRCGHCIDARHGGHGELPLSLVDRLLDQAKPNGFDELSFTGGEPTLHRQFFEILAHAANAGYTFGFVSNGWSFPKVYARLLPFRDHLTAITFSLDGARESTHDDLRGRGSYRRVLQALSVCVATGLPFSLNMVVTRCNSGELAALVELGAALGAYGVRFGPLMPGGDPTLALGESQRRAAQAAIEDLQKSAPIPVGLAPGFETPDLFPCAPLHMQEMNLDWRGNITKCCHLSGYDRTGADVAGNLHVDSFGVALERLREANARFVRHKQARQVAGDLSPSDYAPCLYCHKHIGAASVIRPTARTFGTS